MLEQNQIDSAKFVYSTYLAIKHYFCGNYDYFKYGGVLNKNFLSDFENKPQVIYSSYNIYTKYKDLIEIQKLFVINIKDNKKFWLGNVNHKLYSDFKAFEESSHYHFSKEIKPLFTDGNYNEKFNVSEDYPHSYVFHLYEQGKLSQEVLIILNILTGFLDKAYKRNNNFIFEEDYKKITNYQKFLENWQIFDKKVFLKILKENLEISRKCCTLNLPMNESLNKLK